MPDLKWGCVSPGGRRREQQEINFKQMSVCGFRGIELRAASGRFAPFGRPDLIDMNFGSAHNLVEFIHSCGIDQIVSYYYDPGIAFLEESTSGRSAARPEDHQGIVDSTTPFARFLRDVGGKCLVVKAMGSAAREGALTEAKIKTVADCWNKVGKMTKEYGVKTVVHVDRACAIHSMEDIAKLLSATTPELVGFALDTADATITGMDAVALYEKHYGRVDHCYCVDAYGVETPNTSKQGQVLQWYGEMGTPGGLVNFPALIKAAKQHNYNGWLMIENRQTLNSAHSCMLNSWYVKHVLSKV